MISILQDRPLTQLELANLQYKINYFERTAGEIEGDCDGDDLLMAIAGRRREIADRLKDRIQNNDRFEKRPEPRPEFIPPPPSPEKSPEETGGWLDDIEGTIENFKGRANTAQATAERCAVGIEQVIELLQKVLGASHNHSPQPQPQPVPFENNNYNVNICGHPGNPTGNAVERGESKTIGAPKINVPKKNREDLKDKIAALRAKIRELCAYKPEKERTTNEVAEDYNKKAEVIVDLILDLGTFLNFYNESKELIAPLIGVKTLTDTIISLKAIEDGSTPQMIRKLFSEYFPKMNIRLDELEAQLNFGDSESN